MQHDEPDSPTAQRRSSKVNAQDEQVIVLKEFNSVPATNWPEQASDENLCVSDRNEMFSQEATFSEEEARPLIHDTANSDDGENKDQETLSPWTLAILYTSHFLSMWNSRSYEFAAVCSSL